MEKENKENKELKYQVQVRVTKSEHETIKKAAKKLGLNFGPMLISSTLTRIIKGGL